MKLVYGDLAAREISERIAAATASTTTMKAIPADRRVDGMLGIVLADSSLWCFDADSSAGASSTVLVPDAGSGRWLAIGIQTGTSGVYTASKTILYSALTDADMQQDVAFDAALPAGAVVLGSGANVTAIFDNVGDTANLTFDLGYAADRDAFIDGGSLDAAAKVSTPAGVQPVGLVGAITPSVRVDSSVNLNTLTKGAATFYVLYALAF
jgi:hypothetical protein